MAKDAQTLCASLQNSVVLANLKSCLSHLSASEIEAINSLIGKYPSLYAGIWLMCHPKLLYYVMILM